MRIFSAFIILLAIHSFTYSQTEFDFSGYINEIPMGQFSNEKLSSTFGIDKSFYLNLTRIRLRPVVYFGDNSRINLELESAVLLYQNITGFLASNADKTSRQLVSAKWLIKNNKNLSILNFIDRLYYRQDFDWGNVIIGRQRISWGTGRVWNPVDLFNPINPTSFYKIEKDGADAVSLKYYLGSFSDLNIVFNPMNKLSESNFGFRLRTNFGESDLSFISGKFDGKYIAGYDFAGNLGDAGIRSEGLIKFESNLPFEDKVQFIAGIDYQFTPKLYCLLEYHYNGEGEKNKFNYRLDKLMKGEILNLNKNYLAFSGMYQITPLLNSTLMMLNNMNDKSIFSSLTFSYSYTDNLYLNFGGQIFNGEDFTEYWYYPQTAFIQVEYYF
ncbi:MAG: hypothetical protein D6830_03715 [Ignavibacteria bacterium]|nr:MAG: hypothetical protein D6830_03715 [Ignavibacteria bacterium]